MRRRTLCDSRLPLRPFDCASGPFTPNPQPAVSDAGRISGTGRAPRRSPEMSQMEDTIMNPSTPSGLRGLVVSAIFVVLAPSLSVVSAADPDSASRTVRFADLNISNPSGAQALYMRILGAAQVVCSYHSFATDADKAGCVRDAIADAVTKIDQPALSAVYNAKNKPPVPSRLVSQSR